LPCREFSLSEWFHGFARDSNSSTSWSEKELEPASRPKSVLIAGLGDFVALHESFSQWMGPRLGSYLDLTVHSRRPPRPPAPLLTRGRAGRRSHKLKTFALFGRFPLLCCVLPLIYIACSIYLSRSPFSVVRPGLALTIESNLLESPSVQIPTEEGPPWNHHERASYPPPPGRLARARGRGGGHFLKFY
jgi:hypothetical protein